MSHAPRDAVAVIRLGALGDILVATPALYETITRFPGQPVYAVGSALWLTVLDAALWPGVTGIVTITKKGGQAVLYTPQNGSWHKTAEKITLRSFFGRCAVMINLRIDSLRFLVLAWLARIPRRHGTCPWYVKFLTTHWSPWLDQKTAIHERDRLLRLVEAPQCRFFPLGLQAYSRRKIFRDEKIPNQKSIALPAPDAALALQPHWPKNSLPHKWLGRGLPALTVTDSGKLKRAFNLQWKKYWVVNPTASLVEKAWPADRFREFCAIWGDELKRKNRGLIILGAPNETDWLHTVAGERFRIIQPQNFVDLTNIVAGAQVLVTNTSALQFVAASTATPAITLVGRATPARWGPVGPHDICIWGQLPPKFSGSFRDEEITSYANITVAEVIQATAKMTTFFKPISKALANARVS